MNDRRHGLDKLRKDLLADSAEALLNAKQDADLCVHALKWVLHHFTLPNDVDNHTNISVDWNRELTLRLRGITTEHAVPEAFQALLFILQQEIAGKNNC